MRYQLRNSLLVFALAAFFANAAAAQDWRSVSPMPSPRYGMSVVALEGDIYVIGGRDRGGSPLSTVLRYESDSDTWHTDVPAMEEPRVESAAVVLGGKIYVIGGAEDEGAAEDDVVVYDPAANEWTNAAGLNHERYGHGAVVIDGQIFVLGGSDEDNRLVREVERFDPAEDEWVVSEDWELKNPRVSFALVMIDDTVYAIGGVGSTGPLRIAERFGPRGPDGTFIPPGLLRARLAAASAGNSAYLLGGRGALNRVLNEVLIFTPSANKPWRNAPAMQEARESFGAVSIGSDLYAIGGRNDDDVALSSAEVMSVTTNIASDPAEDILPFRLEQNHPNPFINSTTIPLVVGSERAERVALEIYDLQGRRLATLVDGYLPPGRHEVSWTGGDVLTSGVYFYVLTQGDSRQVRTMTRIR